MSRVRFLIFPRKKVEIFAAANIRTGRIFWQVVPVQQPVQYGRDTAHISWVAWEQIPLEDCMEERQHHLNESSSARLRRSQKLEILPSPNSKSLGAYFLGAYIFHKARRFSTAALLLLYIMKHEHFGCGAYILYMRRYFR
jgi:hypothetical protein